MPYTEFHYTPTGTGVISGKEVLEQTEDAINDLGGQISGDVQTAIDTANNALNVANTASSDAQNAVNTANTAYTAATNAQNTANAAQTTAGNALTAAQNAQNDVNALGNRVTTAENNISQNTSDISGLTTRMGTAEGNITTLQNDVITAQGTATSAQNTATLARGQAYVVRYASVAVSDNSTVPYTDLNNTDNIKANDLLLDTNGKLYQISSVDTANETVSVTTPLTQLAVDANVMHLSGNETVGGFKTFDRYIQCNGGYIGNESSINARTELVLRSNRDTAGQSGIFLTKFRQNKAQGALSGNDVVYLTLDILENSVRTNTVFRFNFGDFVNDVPQDIAFYPTGTKNSLGGATDGSSNNKWHLFNGINPGALSLPDLSNGIDISGYLSVGASTNDSYTAPANGYIGVIFASSSVCGCYVYNYTDGVFMRSNSITDGTYTNVCGCFIPILKNQTLNISTRATESIVSAKFYPCLGNV